MNILYFYLLFLVHPYLGMWWKSFEQADRKAWEALVPGYNYFIAFKISCKKPWWSLLMIFPGVHLVMWSVVNTSYIRRFGYFTLADTAQGIFFPYLILYKIAKSGDKMLPETNWANSKEVGDREWGDHLALFLALPVIGHVIALAIAAVTRAQPGKRSKVKEWGDSLIFAIVAASIIRTYVFEPFQIPTGSMEKTLLVGDFLFVNKLAYGPKIPVTPLSYPLVHNTVPWVNIRSYSTIEQLNYTRFPGYSNIERNDVVVFNYPSGDTAVYDPRMPHGLMGHDYHQILNEEAFYYWQQDLAESGKLKRNDPNSATKLAKYQEEFFQNIEKWRSVAREGLASGVTYSKGPMTEKNLPYIEHYGLIYRPVDKRENYIKRCVGIPGDVIEVIHSELYVNGKKVKHFEFQNLQYDFYNLKLPSAEVMDEKYDLEIHRGGSEKADYYSEVKYVPKGERYFVSKDSMIVADTTKVISFTRINATDSQLKMLLRDFPNAAYEVVREMQYSDNPAIQPTFEQKFSNLRTFPKDVNINNTMTDFTKFTVPKKGSTVPLTAKNIAWYRRIITAYEGHTLSERKDGIYIDGKKVSSYTFAMNYYWMMGDNRYNSADSRVWGFVPEDHIVGKASMVWFSKDPYVGIRWDRIFTLIK